MDIVAKKTIFTVLNLIRFGGPPTLSTFYFTKQCPEDNNKQKCENTRNYTLYAAIILILLSQTFRGFSYILLLGLGPSMLIYYFAKTCSNDETKENCENIRRYTLYTGITLTIIITLLFWGFVF